MHGSDGLADATVYSMTNGTWGVMVSAGSYVVVITRNFGGTGCQAVAGDYDGDGISDPAYYQQSVSTWYIKLSSLDYAIVTIEQ